MKYLTPKEYGIVCGLSFFSILLLSILRVLIGYLMGNIESMIAFLIFCIIFYYYVFAIKNLEQKGGTENTNTQNI